jgi:hypothetical protein
MKIDLHVFPVVVTLAMVHYIADLPTYVLGGKQCMRENWPMGC